MIQRGQNLGFALEPRHALGVGGEGFGQDFQRHVAAQLRVARAIHLAHPARANLIEGFIGADFRSANQRHKWARL